RVVDRRPLQRGSAHNGPPYPYLQCAEASRSGPDTRHHAKPGQPPAARRFVPGWVTPSVVVCGQRRQAPKGPGREHSMGSVWIAGSYQSDFARNYAREGLEISDMVAEALQGTLRSAGLEPEDVEFIHVGNAFGQLFTGQGQLGAMPATAEPRLWGKPA